MDPFYFYFYMWRSCENGHMKMVNQISNEVHPPIFIFISYYHCLRPLTLIKKFGKTFIISKFHKKECIPVGCVLPTCWLYPVVSDWGGSAQPPWMQTQPRGKHPPWMQTPPHWIQTPPHWRQTSWRQTHLIMWPVLHAGKPTFLLIEWHTAVKTLPCPKLCLRVEIKIEKVTMQFFSRFWSIMMCGAGTYLIIFCTN